MNKNLVSKNSVQRFKQGRKIGKFKNPSRPLYIKRQDGNWINTKTGQGYKPSFMWKNYDIDPNESLEHFSEVDLRPTDFEYNGVKYHKNADGTITDMRKFRLPNNLVDPQMFDWRIDSTSGELYLPKIINGKKHVHIEGKPNNWALANLEIPKTQVDKTITKPSSISQPQTSQKYHWMKGYRHRGQMFKNRDEVAKYQREVLGLTGSAADGVWGKNTEAAYQKYLKKASFTPNYKEDITSEKEKNLQIKKQGGNLVSRNPIERFKSRNFRLVAQ